MPEIPRHVYEKVYEYKTDKEPSLEWFYVHFTRHDDGDWPPKDYEGRSMSVGDIIETPDGKLWFCDSFRWTEVKWRENNE